jgi:hypothetical protein
MIRPRRGPAGVDRSGPARTGIDEVGQPISFALLALATWRLTHLLVHEDGPNDLVLRLRRAAGSSTVGRAMDCFYCASLWVAAPCAAVATRSSRATAPWWQRDRSRRARSIERVTMWMALSAAACLLQHLTTSVDSPGELDELDETDETDETDATPVVADLTSHPRGLAASGTGS